MKESVLRALASVSSISKDVADLATSITPENPEVVKLRAKVAELRMQVMELTNKTIEVTEDDAQTLRVNFRKNLEELTQAQLSASYSRKFFLWQPKEFRTILASELINFADRKNYVALPVWNEIYANGGDL